MSILIQIPFAQIISLNSREQECLKVSSLNKVSENFSINFKSAANQLPS